MKKKISRILGVAVALVLVLSLAVALAPAAPVNQVSADEGAWAKFPTPRPGALNSYLLAPTYGTAAGPGPLAKAIDGTLYIYWDIGETDNLFKSTDNGRTWSRCSSSTDELPAIAIVDIACSKEDADLLYVTSASTVYRSNDAGATFTAISPLTSYLDDSDEVITSMDVGHDGTSHWIVVGTSRPATVTPDGEVYIKQDPYLGPWQEQDITDNRSVLDVACAPDFATANPLIVAVTDNSTGTNVTTSAFVEYQYSGGAWTHVTEFKFKTSATATLNTGENLTSADIAFPTDFESSWPNPDYFVGINTANTSTNGPGDVYHVVASTILDCDVDGAYTGTDIRSIALGGSIGDTMILAGTGDDTDIFHSEDDGDTWRYSLYDASGASNNAYVAVSDDYYDSGIGWAAVSGSQSAFSQTTNFGVAWYQISLIETTVDAINDLAFSPAYAEDSTMFMVSANSSTGIKSVWRHESYWERTCDNLTHVQNDIDGIKVSPDFATDTAVFIADTGSPKLWRSTDGGYRFKKQAGAPTAFAGGWVVIDSSTLIVGYSTGSNATQISKNNGTTWSTKGITGCNNPTTFALSSNYDEDSTIIMGDDNDGVFRSTDGGSKWSQVPAGVDVESGAGTLYVAFDTDYANNNTIYASAGDTSDVYRLVIDTDTSWKTIDAAAAVTWPGASKGAAGTGNITGIATGEGVLYTTDNWSNAVLRSVNPTLSYLSSRGVYFEKMSSGWTTATAAGLWLTAGASNVLWTIRGGDAIYSYEDLLTVAPDLTGPEEGYSTGRATTATLSWTELPTAKQYFVWVSTTDAFATSSIQSAADGEPFNAGSSTTSFRVTGLSSGKTYYWKVCSADGAYGRATTALGRALGPWSEVRSFSTGIAGGEWNPFRTAEGYPGNVAPEPGSTGVQLQPPFQWNAADWADGYEFVLADNPAYTSPIVSKTIETSAYALDKDLKYSTSYYWKVKATSETTESKWGEGVFTTMAKPAPPAPPAAPPKPAEIIVEPKITVQPGAPILPMYMVWVIIGIGAILVIAVIILIVRTRRVV